MQHGSYDALSSALTVSRQGLAYRLDGTEAETVVLIHGVGSSSDTWSRLIPYLYDHYRLLRYDLRGHGRSAPAPEGCSLGGFLDDHLALLAELGVTRAHLVGFSLGALIAQKVALEAPETVERLVLLSCAGDREEADRSRVLARLEAVRTTSVAELARRSGTRWFTRAFIESNPEDVAAEIEIVSATDHGTYESAYEVLARSELSRELPRIASPTLLVTGENDAGSTPRMSFSMGTKIPGAIVRVVPRLQHYLHVEVPDLVATLIMSFLADGDVPLLASGSSVPVDSSRPT